MYNKHNLEVYKFTSKSDIKQELNCVAFFGNKTVATDSYRLIEVSANGEAHEPILVQRDYVQRLKLGNEELVNIDSFPDGRIKGTFPDYETIIAREQKREEVTINVNGKFLGETLLQMAKLTKTGSVTLSVSGDAKGRPVIIMVDGGQKARALVMPIVGKPHARTED
jgi:DNA polymerase III sliding clamp (beta) subunit (PCNA family)